MSTPPFKPQEPALIGKNYQIEKTIGQGTFGKVKLALHTPTNEYVAIKILEKSKIQDNDEIFFLEKEINCLKALSHPNIIQIYEIIENTNNFYIVMEYASGGDLFNHIVQNQRLSEQEASYFYTQIIYGIEEIHKHKICHRDIKPENILLTPNKILKIIDFGLSCEYDTFLETPCGSPYYASPEMIRGVKYNGLSIDIWSSGIILYAMVCGYLPFDDNNHEKLFEKILQCNVEFPNETDVTISPECKDLIKKILTPISKQRISLEEIKLHPFLSSGIEQYKNNNIQNEMFDKEDFIMSYMVDKLSYSNKDMIKFQLNNNQHNYISTTYKLLKKKLIEGRFNDSNCVSIQSVPSNKQLTKDKRTFNMTPSLSTNQSMISELNNVIVKDKEYDYPKPQTNIILINNTNMITSKHSLKINHLYNKIINKNNGNKNKFTRNINTSVSVDKTINKTEKNSKLNKHLQSKTKSKDKSKQNCYQNTNAVINSYREASVSIKSGVNNNLKNKRLINIKHSIPINKKKFYNITSTTPYKHEIHSRDINSSISPVNQTLPNKHKETVIPKVLNSLHLKLNSRAVSDSTKRNKVNSSLQSKDKSKQFKNNQITPTISPGHKHKNNNNNNSKSYRTRNIIQEPQHKSKYSTIHSHRNNNSNHINSNRTVGLDYDTSSLQTAYHTQYTSTNHKEKHPTKTKCLNVEIPHTKLKSDLSPNTQSKGVSKKETVLFKQHTHHNKMKKLYEPLSTRNKSIKNNNINHSKTISSNLHSVRNTHNNESNLQSNKKKSSNTNNNNKKNYVNFISFGMKVNTIEEGEKKLFGVCQEEQYEWEIEEGNIYVVKDKEGNKIKMEFEKGNSGEKKVNLWHHSGDTESSRKVIKGLMQKLY